jgi:hypothetical protein
MLRNFGAVYVGVMEECFPGIETEEVHSVIDKRDLGSLETVIIHVRTNDLRTNRNLDFVMGEVNALVAAAYRKHPKRRLFLSGVLRHSHLSWRRSGALKDRYDWVAKA